MKSNTSSDISNQQMAALIHWKLCCVHYHLFFHFTCSEKITVKKKKKKKKRLGYCCLWNGSLQWVLTNALVEILTAKSLIKLANWNSLQTHVAYGDEYADMGTVCCWAKKNVEMVNQEELVCVIKNKVNDPW